MNRGRRDFEVALEVSTVIDLCPGRSVYLPACAMVGGAEYNRPEIVQK